MKIQRINEQKEQATISDILTSKFSAVNIRPSIKQHKTFFLYKFLKTKFPNCCTYASFVIVSTHEWRTGLDSSCVRGKDEGGHATLTLTSRTVKTVKSLNFVSVC